MDATEPFVPLDAVETFSEGTSFVVDRWKRFISRLVPFALIMFAITIVAVLLFLAASDFDSQPYSTDSDIPGLTDFDTPGPMFWIGFLVLMGLIFYTQIAFQAGSFQSVAAEYVERPTSWRAPISFGMANSWRVLLLILMLFGVLLVAIVFGVALFMVEVLLGVLYLFLGFVAYIYFLVRFIPLLAVLFIEQKGPVDAVKRTLELTKRKWWHCTGVGVLCMLALGGIQMIMSLLLLIPILNIVIGIVLIAVFPAFCGAWYASVQTTLYLSLRSRLEPTTPSEILGPVAANFEAPS